MSKHSGLTRLKKPASNSQDGQTMSPSSGGLAECVSTTMTSRANSIGSRILSQSPGYGYGLALEVSDSLATMTVHMWMCGGAGTRPWAVILASSESEIYERLPWHHRGGKRLDPGVEWKGQGVSELSSMRRL